MDCLRNLLLAMPPCLAALGNVEHLAVDLAEDFVGDLGDLLAPLRALPRVDDDVYDDTTLRPSTLTGRQQQRLWRDDHQPSSTQRHHRPAPGLHVDHGPRWHYHRCPDRHP